MNLVYLPLEEHENSFYEIVASKGDSSDQIYLKS